MADKNKKNRLVDDAGIRLAPTPLHGENSVTMPSVRQSYVISPELQVDAPKDELQQKATVTTEHDFQPKKKDVSKQWKRRRRSKNATIGIIMLVLTIVVLMQYILGLFEVKIKGVNFVLVPQELGALNNIVHAIKFSARMGWGSYLTKQMWIEMVPSLILFVGIIALLANAVMSIAWMFNAIKPRRYFVPALIYLLMVLAVLIVYLVGAPALGVEQVDFKTDVIKAYQTSELLSIVVFALGYFLAATVCSWVTSEKYGYLK